MNYYVSTNGSTWVLCANANIEAPVLTYRANGLDDLSFRIKGDFLATPAFAYASTIYLATSPDGATFTCRFVGRITEIPRSADGTSEELFYRASGPWWWLEQISFMQQFRHMESATHTLANVVYPRVILGQTNGGSQIDYGAQIAAVIDYAISVGAPFLKGTIDTLTIMPFSEHTNLRCADAIRQCLRFFPDSVCWFDYDSRVNGVPVPTFHCRQPANLATATVAILNSTTNSISMTPRYDLLVPGIKVFYDSLSTINGESYRSVSTDTAGTTTDPRAVPLLWELDGSNIETVSQAITVAAYPASPYTNKTFWRSLVPFLADIADADLVISNVTRAGGYPLLETNYLTEGQITQWMIDTHALNAHEETWTAEVQYIRKNAGNVEAAEKKKVRVKLLSTDGVTRTYTALATQSAAESVPTGVAAALYASWSRLHWDGEFGLVGQDAAFSCLPGMLANLTGGLSDWSTMNALVQIAVIDLTQGTSRITTGTCGRLEADSLLALWRAAHFRRFSFNRLMRTDAAFSSSGVKVDGGKQLARLLADTSDPGVAQSKRYTGTDSGAHTHTATIDPSSVAFATSGDAADKNLTIQELYLPVPISGDPGGVEGKKAQVLSCAPYGTARAIIPATKNLAQYKVLQFDSNGVPVWDWVRFNVGAT